MFCLRRSFILGLMLFSSAAYALATSDQAQIGKVTGFTGPADTEMTSDYLTAAFCYCEYPPKIADVMGLAHYYQIEYYNVHLNTTFILTSICPDEGIGKKRSCVPPSGGEEVLAGDTMSKYFCKEFKGYQTIHDQKPHDDWVCYLPVHHHGDDYIQFNEQKRNLGKTGAQGQVFQDQRESERVCEGLCRENMDAGIFKDDLYMQSHVVEWNHLDDMCGHCR